MRLLVNYEGIERTVGENFVRYKVTKDFSPEDLVDQTILGKQIFGDQHILPIIISLYGWEKLFIYIEFRGKTFRLEKLPEWKRTETLIEYGGRRFTVTVPNHGWGRASSLEERDTPGKYLFSQIFPDYPKKTLYWVNERGTIKKHKAPLINY